MVFQAIKLGLGALVVVAISNLGASAAEGEKPPKLEPAALEKMMIELAKPGSQHEHFKELVGQWTADVKSTCPMTGEKHDSTGSSTFRLLMGGRYLQQRFKCEMDGKPYQGLGICAYDKGKKKFISIWIDNMGTGIMMSEGKYDEASGTLTEIGESASPIGNMKFRMVTKPVNDDKFTFTMYMTMPKGAENKAMEITYTRKK